MKQRQITSICETSKWTKDHETCHVHSTKEIVNGKLEHIPTFTFTGKNPFPCYSMRASYGAIQDFMVLNGWDLKPGGKRTTKYYEYDTETGEVINEGKETVVFVPIAETETKANKEEEDFSLPKEWIPGLEKALKEKYLDAADRAKEGTQVFTLEMLSALKEMAKADVYPDGRFSDTECNVWSLFR